MQQTGSGQKGILLATVRACSQHTFIHCPPTQPCLALRTRQETGRTLCDGLLIPSGKFNHTRVRLPFWLTRCPEPVCEDVFLAVRALASKLCSPPQSLSSNKSPCWSQNTVHNTCSWPWLRPTLTGAPPAEYTTACGLPMLTAVMLYCTPMTSRGTATTVLPWVG